MLLQHETVEVSIYQRGDRAAKAETLIAFNVEGWPPARVSTKEVTETWYVFQCRNWSFVEVSIYGHAQCKEVTETSRSDWDEIDSVLKWVSTKEVTGLRKPKRLLLQSVEG